jgi:peptide/nickel transport system ATP-binding protein
VTDAATPALSLSRLRVAVREGAAIVEDVELELRRGEILGLVGESGSGKTTTILSLFGYVPPGVSITSMDLTVAGQPLQNEKELRRARGRLLSYVPQNPGLALNPSLRVVEAIEDMIRAHRGKTAARDGARQWLQRVHLPATDEFGRRYPHQLSGGQQQRVSIAAALACEPAVVVLDEPTTGLDVVTQARILQELVRLRDEEQVSMVYVTHDLAVVAQIADQIAVMYAGRIVEQGPRNEVLGHPRHPYTRGLLASIPDHLRARVLQPMPGIALGVGERPDGCPFAARCSHRVSRCEIEMPELEESTVGHRVRCFEWRRIPPFESSPPQSIERALQPTNAPMLEVTKLKAEHRSRRHTIVAARDVSFSVNRGACVALVGESGSGKTTIARAIAGLHPIAGGQISFAGERLASLARHRTSDQRRRMQIVFQNPADALNPRHTVRRTIARPASVLRGLSTTEATAEVDRLLEAVRLPLRLASRYPEELSGGERQRVSIARALAAAPELIICDEITSQLDVSVQAAVIEILDDLRTNLGLTLVFITHDLGVVATVADYVLVLEEGIVCEQGPPDQILGAPKHSYTRRLLASAPSLSAAIEAWKVADGTASVELINKSQSTFTLP